MSSFDKKLEEELEKLKKKKQQNPFNVISPTFSTSSKNSLLGGSLSYLPTYTAPLSKKVQTGVNFTAQRMVDTDGIAPVMTVGSIWKKDEEDEGKLDFFQKSKAFSDGYDVGDITKTILGTAGDAGVNAVHGLLGMVEGVGDALLYGASGLERLTAGITGRYGEAERLKKMAQENTMDDSFKGAEDFLDQYSVLGRTSKSVFQGVGQVGGMIGLGAIGGAVGLGAGGTTALTTGTMGVSGFGSGMGEAYKAGATDEEAVTYGIISGAADSLSELLFGGLGKAVNAVGFSKGLSSVDDMLAKKVSSLFQSQLAKNVAEYGIKAGAEGFEEVVAGTAQAIGKKLTYMSEKELGEILEDENLLEQFVVGAVTSGVAQAPGLHIANKTKTDFITGQTQNEQAVVKKEVENRIAEAEKDGKKLSAKEKSAIEAQVEKDLERGYISTDTIEEVLGGESYKAYKDTVDSEKALTEKRKALQAEFDTLNKMKQGEMTGEQIDRRADLKEELAKLDETILSTENHSPKDLLKERLSKSVSEMVRSDRLSESYKELARREQFFAADLNKYDTKQRAVIQKAIESRVLNNTNRTHEFVDMVARISADKGVLFDFTNNKKLKESGFAVAGKTVNGFVTKDGITVNVDAKASRRYVVGHEITHVLEGTEMYTELQNAIFEYAKTKGDYQARYDSLSKLYESVEGADVNAELTADLVGEYLFTDDNFINNLSVKHRNVFQKVYDEIKYLLKVATAGSKEARELEKVKRAFEKAYREGVNAQQSEEISDSKTKYSIREEAPPKNTGVAYKVFYVKDGKLYPPMVANPGGADTPMGVWLNADMGTAAPPSKTGRAQVKAGGKGTQGGGGSLAFRPGWHLGDLPRASQFDRVNPETGKKELFPENFVWAEVEYAKDVDYQEEAMSYGYTDKGKFRHAYAGLPRLPENGYYRYRTNPKPDTVPWVITGAMKVNRLLSDAEVNAILEKNGVAPVHRQGGDVGLDKFGFKEDGTVKYSISDENIKDISTGYGYGETYYTMSYTQDGKVVATLEYGEYDGEPNVKMIEVSPEYRRKGIATKLMQELQRKYPDTEINFGMSTPDGTKLLESITYDVTDEAVVADRQKLKNLQTELNDLQEKLDVLYDTDPLTAEQDAELHRLGDRWQEVYEAIHDLSEDLWGKKATRTFVKTDAKYSLSAEQQEFFKDSVVRDENGDLKVMYHGTSRGGFTVFDTYGSNYGLFGTGSYFTDSKTIGESYTKKGKGKNPQVYEAYLNIKNPMDMDAPADPAAWAEAFPDASFPTSGTNEDFYRAMEEYFEDNQYPRWEAAEVAMDAIEGMGYDGITHIGGGRVRADSERHRVYIAFQPEQIKSVDNTKPTADPDIRYSLSEDSDGKRLTEAQADYFKKSKMRDDTGNLKPMYHGTMDGGFHTFESVYSDDSTSFFFTDKNSVAESYSGTSERYEAQTFRTAEDFNKFFARIGATEYQVREEGGEFHLYEDGDSVASSSSADEIYEEFRDWSGLGYGNVNYKVYLNLENPLEIDAEGRQWSALPAIDKESDVYEYIKVVAVGDGLNEVTVEYAMKGDPSPVTETVDLYKKFNDSLADTLADMEPGEVLNGVYANPSTTRDYAQYAKKNGYDGVIFKNIYDNGGYGGNEKSTVAIAFNSNQIKSTANENPTPAADIRYSLSADNEGRKLSNEQIEFFKDSKAVDENGNLKVVYHGTRNADFTVFKRNVNFFTDSKEMADSYSPNGDMYEGYVNITKPYEIDAAGEKWSKIPIDAETKDFLQEYGASVFKEGGKWRTTPADLASAIEEAVDNGDMDYDGIIIKNVDDTGSYYKGNDKHIATDYIVFNSNQFKNADNTHPTADKDIRRSLSDGQIKPVSDPLSDLRLEVAPVAENATTEVSNASPNTANASPVLSNASPVLDNATVSKEEMVEMFPDELEPDQMELDRLNQERDDLEAQMMEMANSGDFSELEAVGAQHSQVMERIAALEGEISEADSGRMDSIMDEDAPPEMDAPYYGEPSEPAAPADPFEDRDISDVGDRKVKAYQYENPEVKPFFMEAALGMLDDLNRTTKGEKIFNGDVYYQSGGEDGWMGTKRSTTSDIAELLDNWKYSYVEIEKGLNAIIEDDGKENNAVSKRIEFMLNDRLLNGYTDVWGEYMPPNQGYINLLHEKQITEYSKEAFDSFMATADQYAPAEDIAPAPAPVRSVPMETALGSKEVSGQQTYIPYNATYDAMPNDADIGPTAELASGQKELYMPITPRKQPKMVRVDKAGSEQVANVLTEEPKAESKRGKLWSMFKENVLDSGMVFEDLALKTKNRELQAKWNFRRYAQSMAQRMVGNGADGVKSLNAIREEVEKTGKVQQFYEYLYHRHNVDRMRLEERYEDVSNKPVFGYNVTADHSEMVAKEIEQANPNFKRYARDVYNYMNHLRNMMVNNGVISQDTANLWAEMYPHYVPIRRAGDNGLNINVPLDTGRTGVNAPVKRATGGNSDILPLFDTMGQRTMQTFRAIANNNFGVELKNTLGSTIGKERTDVDGVIDSMDNQDGLLQEGKNGRKPTFTVFENGEKVTFEITEEMYNAIKPSSDGWSATVPVVSTASKIHRGLLTEYNPVFMATNAIKDTQDILINSQHPARTYANLPRATLEIARNGKWYQEYMENGGEDNSYFDGETNTFDTKEKGARKLLGLPPLSWISKANNFVERTPRLAEYIASRESGRSIETSMLDAARVTTNFAAGGKLTKFANRNGATFLNASVQGVVQQARNIREAKANGLKGWAQLAGKVIVAGLPAILLNNFMWDDDDDYEELSDYVKQNYYIVGKFGDGKFVRIPKGRTVAVIQNAIEQISNVATGNDEADLKSFLELVVSNLAPNNPVEDNILAPIIQVAKNETWYGEDLVPTRLQDVPVKEQFDESTDSLSKWLGEKLNLSPYKLNYLLDQYSGGIGDTILPMLTPEAKSGADSLGGYLAAPWKSKFTTDSVMNNQNVSDFYDVKDELTTNAKASTATDEDKLMSKYMNSVNAELSELYAQKRKIQNSGLPAAAKYDRVRDIQEQIVALTKEGLATYEDIVYEGDIARIGDRLYQKNDEGEWQKLSGEQVTKYEVTKAAGDALYATDGTNHYRWYEPGEDAGEDAEPGWRKVTEKELERQNKITSSLGITPEEYWANREEYSYAYDNPETYAVAKAVGGYKAYKQYSSDLYDIKADKDKYGKSISGSRKEKVLDYINGLDADYYTKLILYKSEYNSYDDANHEIIDYLNGRDDISFDEMRAILIKLGFKVDAEGNIYW